MGRNSRQIGRKPNTIAIERILIETASQVEAMIMDSTETHCAMPSTTVCLRHNLVLTSSEICVSTKFNHTMQLRDIKAIATSVLKRMRRKRSAFTLPDDKRKHIEKSYFLKTSIPIYPNHWQFLEVTATLVE